MNDGELTRLAIKLLEKEGQKFVRERALTKPGPLKANKAFLRAQLKHNEISNRRINSKSESPPSTAEDTVNKPKSKQSQYLTNTDYHVLSKKRHVFNRNCLKNKTHVGKLTKDPREPFKCQNKEKLLMSSDEIIDYTQKMKDYSAKVKEYNDKMHSVVRSYNESELIIDVSDTDSVISVSSSDHSDCS